MSRHLLLAGGGHSHVEVLRRWALAPEPDTRLTLLSPDRLTPYSGMVPGLIAGHYRAEECHIDLAALCAAAGATQVTARVAALDPAGHRVITDDGRVMAYDWLAIDVGAMPATSGIAGSRRYGIPIRPVAGFLTQWHELRAAALMAPRPLELAVVGGGAAGVEVVLAMQHRINAEGGRARFTLVTGGSGLLPALAPAVRRHLARILADRQIRLCQGAAVTRAGAGRLELADGRIELCDEVVWANGSAAPAWLRASGVACDAGGYLAVDATLRSISHREIFGSGDAASQVGSPRPKSGVYAVRHGPPLHDNLRCVLRGEPLREYRPQRRTLALISTGERCAVASYGTLACHGPWVWRWKDHIDRSFIARYHGA